MQPFKNSRFFLSLLLVFTIIGACSPGIRTITEYKHTEDGKILNRKAEFDLKGNKLLEQYYGSLRSNPVIRNTYADGNLIHSVQCDYFKRQDTCVLRQFSVVEHFPIQGLRIHTMYEADSAIRYIRKHHRSGKLEVVKTRSWEMNPTKDPNPDMAMNFIDSIFYDNRQRAVLRIHLNERSGDSWKERYEYQKSGFKYTLSGTRMDTTYVHKYSAREKRVLKKKLDFKFKREKDYSYDLGYH